jgi:hypothetical protein
VLEAGDGSGQLAAALDRLYNKVQQGVTTGMKELNMAVTGVTIKPLGSQICTDTCRSSMKE